MKWRSLPESGPYSDARPLSRQLAEREALGLRYVPASVRAVHLSVVQQLKESQVAQSALAVGAISPAFERSNHDGTPVALSNLLAHRRLVLMFFRGRWCPFCVGQLEAMSFLASAFSDAGATLVAISPQTVKHNYLMHDQHHLRFPLLSDAGNQLARQFGLVYRVPEAQQEIYSSVFVNLPFINADDSWELPIPATFVIDRDGKVLWNFADADYTKRPEPAEILQFLESLPR